MSLVRLLAAGNSLAGGPDTASRYRMNNRGLLPKFISPKNPFATPAKIAPPPVQTEMPRQDGPSEAPALVRPAKPASKPSPVRVCAAWLAKLARRVSERMRKLNPLSRFSRRKLAPKAVASALIKLPVQGELRLENVQVVRNDLSETDWEVVTVAAKPAAKDAGPVLPAAGKPASGWKPWNQLTARVLGARTT
jgi:hypothetical protein